MKIHDVWYRVTRYWLNRDIGKTLSIASRGIVKSRMYGENRKRWKMDNRHDRTLSKVD